LSRAEQDWIEKYRAALHASARTEESRFKRVVRAIANVIISPFRKISGRPDIIETPQSAKLPHPSKRQSSTSKIKATSGKHRSSQPQRKRKAS
jgi:hypothetical protein